MLSQLARAQEPVLAYSARVGPDTSAARVVAVGGDGSVYLASRTQQAADAEANALPKLLLAKLTPNGSSVQCSLTLDGDAAAMAVADDGAVILTGSTASPTFPITTVAPRNSGRFLARADVCGQGVTYATWLPGSVRGVAVTTNGGKIWVATDDSVLRYEIGGTAPVAEVPVNGIPGAITFSGGRLYVTGTRGQGPFRAFLMRFDPATMKVEYDIVWGDGPVAAGTSLAVQADGNAWVAGPALAEGLAPAANYSEPGGVPYWGGFFQLTRVTPGGTVTLNRLVAQPLGGYNPALGLGGDGRVWIAIPGVMRYPHDLPSSPQVNGVYLRSFDNNGDATGAGTMIPCNSRPAVAFGNAGRVAVACISPAFPLTPASVDSGNPAGVTTVVSDLAVTNAPALICDRETLSVPLARVGSVVYLDQQTIGCSSSDGSSIAFTASVVPGLIPAQPGSSASGYSIVSGDDRTPASIAVRSNDRSSDGILILLAPGVQGPTAIPVRSGEVRPLPRLVVSRIFDSLPGPVGRVVEGTLALSWEAGGVSLPVPYRLTSSVPWLTFDKREGVAPMEVRLLADATGLPRGEHFATVTAEVDGAGPSRVTLPLRIGPLFNLEGTVGPVGDIQVPVGAPFIHKVRIGSTGQPMDFTIVPPGGPFTITPLSGTTPAEITIVVDPSGYAVGDRPRLLTAIHSAEAAGGLSVTFRIVPRVAAVLPDSLRGSGAPGGLIYYVAGGASRCDTSTAAAPWPTALGGCRLRVNGQPIPLGSVTLVPAPPNPNFILEPLYFIRAQLPYNISGTVNAELEDKNGLTTSVPLTIQPVAPEWLGFEGTGPQELPVRRPGERITILVNGLGATDAPTPPGDVPSTAIRPTAPLEVFIGGRTARIFSAELSSTDPGVVEVTAEIPVIAPDVHPLVLRIAGNVVNGASVQILPRIVSE